MCNRLEDKVTFKCLGSTKDKQYQDCLKEARDKLERGLVVPVRLLHEHDNPADKNAVAFQCQVQHGGAWKTFGYVARELTVHVRTVLETEKLVSARFKWVKWRSWARSGVGLYAAVDVVIRGCWPYEVHAKSSF